MGTYLDDGVEGNLYDNDSLSILLTSPTPPPMTSGNDTMTSMNVSVPSSFEVFIKNMNRFGMPVVILTGLFGNTISFIVFTATHLRYQSSSIYLAFLNAVDNIFLLSLWLGVWFGWVKVFIVHQEGWCQTIIYFSYVSSFLSVWTVVGFTVERFIVVYLPLRRHDFCTRSRAIRFVVALSICALLMYSFALWTSGTHKIGRRNMLVCMTHPQFMDLVHILMSVDTMVTLAIPSVVIIILNVSITAKIWEFSMRRRRHLLTNCTCHWSFHRADGPPGGQPGAAPATPAQGGVRRAASVRYQANGAIQLLTNADEPPSPAGNLKAASPRRLTPRKDAANPPAATDPPNSRSHSGSDSSGGGGGSGCSNSRTSRTSKSTSAETGSARFSQHQQGCRARALTGIGGRQRMQLRTTRSLLIVSSVFVILNLPSHAFRLHVFVTNMRNNNYIFSRNVLLWQQVFQMLSYINFCVNFFLYCSCSRQFRSGLRRLAQRLSRAVTHGCSAVRHCGSSFCYCITFYRRGHDTLAARTQISKLPPVKETQEREVQ